MDGPNEASLKYGMYEYYDPEASKRRYWEREREREKKNKKRKKKEEEKEEKEKVEATILPKVPSAASIR